MLIIALVVIAAVGIMVVLGASVLESEHNKRHPPDIGDGCEEARDNDES